MSGEEANDELARLRSENEALKKRGPAVRMKVSEKGAVSIYGMGRFPVTLYKEQWMSIFGACAPRSSLRWISRATRSADSPSVRAF